MLDSTAADETSAGIEPLVDSTSLPKDADNFSAQTLAGLNGLPDIGMIWRL